MDFADKVKELAAQFDKIKDHVVTEEATKNSMVMPFLQTLGYDIFNPLEVIPEFRSAFGSKNDARVDYAIVFNQEPTILIEVKKAKTPLQLKGIGQLFPYYAATKKSRFAILTNGIQYQFFADLDQKNLMDEQPFLTLDVVPSIRDLEISELQKFCKENFNPEKIISGAELLKYTGEIKRFIRQQIKEPGEEFTKFFLRQTSFPGIASKPTVEKFSPIVANAFRQYSQEVVIDTIKVATEKNKPIVTIDPELSIKEQLCLLFWTQLLEYAKTKTSIYSKLSPSKGTWISSGAGIAGLTYCCSMTKHQSVVELYVFRGKDSGQENKEIFEKLITAKQEIEQSFGEQLEWEPLENKQACRIKKVISVGGYLDEQEWPKVQERMVDATIRLGKALHPQIQILKKNFG